MIIYTITALLCAAIGSFFNYLGVTLIIEAFAFSGGDAIGLFCAGIIIAIASLIPFSMFAMLGKALFEEIKEHLK